MIKIHKMIIDCIKTFQPTVSANIPFTKFLEGHNGLSWNLIYTSPKPILMGLFSCLQLLPSHYLTTFEEAFFIGYFESQTHIFGPIPERAQLQYLAYQFQDLATPLPQFIKDIEVHPRLKKF